MTNEQLIDACIGKILRQNGIRSHFVIAKLGLTYYTNIDILEDPAPLIQRLNNLNRQELIQVYDAF